MLVQRIIEALAPAACAGCGQQGRGLCSGCGVASPAAVARCYGCTRPAGAANEACRICRLRAPLAGVIAAADYGGALREAILALKFRHSRSLAGDLAGLITERCTPPAGLGLVTSVPIAPDRYRERGFNQSELIARAVAARWHLPYRMLLGRQAGDHQLGRSRRDRFTHVDGAFFAVKRLRGERVLIVDDVLTTGATLAECSRVLTAAGAGEVWGATVARRR